MKAGSNFLNAVSAVALSASMVVTGGSFATLVSASVAEAAVIRSIQVRGASRVSADTVKANITITPGKNFSNADIDASVRRLFATGYFSDVKVSVSGSTLVVTVDENQLINQVVINGNRKIKDEKLAPVLRSQSLGPYSETAIEADKQAIRDAYASIGRSDATVTTQVYPLGNGRVNVAFVVDEGDRTKISQINFVGNQAYSNSRLQAVVVTKKSNFLSFLTRKDVYSEDKLRADEEALRQFYFNNGYADFRVVSSEAVLDEASNEYVVTFTVEEGQRYDFGEINVESTVDGIDGEELKGLVESRPGKTYRARDVQDSMSEISKRVAANGYPFARVTPRGNRDLGNGTIAVDYLVDQGERAYVERIEIRGNTRTRDYVIRREFDIGEGDAFNQEVITRAKRRLEALGYFSTVNITTAPGSSADRVVLVVDVQDQSTGSFGIGAGYETGNKGGFKLEASIEEKNFLGRGQYIRVAAGGGENSRDYNLSFTEPYFLGYRLAAGFDVFKNEDDSEDYYSVDTQGFTLRVTAPITEDLSTSLRYNYTKLDYKSGDLDELSSPYQHVVVNGPWVRSSVSHSLTYDTIDDRTLPRDGIFAQITQEFAGLGGDSDFYKISGKARYFHTLLEDADVIGSIAVSGGHMWGRNDVKVFDQFTLSANDLRGFESSGIGPRATSTGDALGGTTYFTASAEASFPLPFISRDSGFRGAVFVDAGTLYGNDVKTVAADRVRGDDMSLRASVGASIIWASPFGPLRVDYAVPVKKESFDEVQRFKFGIATQF
ncbi:outer membrane protein assembly protein YaeT [Shinella sp. SUS2]|uniref:outer membrane protein assembly factor BamA n=1 Tax=unclassified Shinella TaxID=2643062 RepID=UPI000682B69A|nr:MULTISPECIES: outer membrane protein assembly factor BamA [unclassified Shinella]KNY17010.1 outer membrane protein assembly protein YaeT [Shinella sp. SUS2]KOC73759.1 outer membrane assembly protein [Shinella sp. GWS1]